MSALKKDPNVLSYAVAKSATSDPTSCPAAACCSCRPCCHAWNWLTVFAAVDDDTPSSPSPSCASNPDIDDTPAAPVVLACVKRSAIDDASPNLDSSFAAVAPPPRAENSSPVFCAVEYCCSMFAMSGASAAAIAV